MKCLRAGIPAMLLAGMVSGCTSGPPSPPGGQPPGGAMLQESKIARPIAILFTGVDENQDLVLSRQELDAAIDREFARADADQSGVITGFEMVDWCLKMMGDKEAQPDLRTMDNDMSYTVTPHEFAVALRHEFDRMDKGQDGALTRSEMLMDAPRMQMGNPGGQGGGAPQGQGGGRGRGPGGGGRGPSGDGPG